MIALWVALGAGVGAPLRYLTDRGMSGRFATRLPVGTLLVNLVAAFVLGLLTGVAALDPRVLALLGTGFCGALSTWSTLAYEAVSLRSRAVAASHLALSLAGGIGLAALGWAVTS